MVNNRLTSLALSIDQLTCIYKVVGSSPIPGDGDSLIIHSKLIQEELPSIFIRTIVNLKSQCICKHVMVSLSIIYIYIYYIYMYVYACLCV